MCLPRERATADSTEGLSDVQTGENQAEDPSWTAYYAAERRFEEIDMESKFTWIFVRDHNKMLFPS